MSINSLIDREIPVGTFVIYFFMTYITKDVKILAENFMILQCFVLFNSRYDFKVSFLAGGS